MRCRSLQQSSGAHILVDQNYPEGADRMVIIKGPRENVTRAAAMINELIAGEPGSASAIISKVGQRPAQYTMCVDSDLAGTAVPGNPDDGLTCIYCSWCIRQPCFLMSCSPRWLCTVVV